VSLAGADCFARQKVGLSANGSCRVYQIVGCWPAWRDVTTVSLRRADWLQMGLIMRDRCVFERVRARWDGRPG